MTTACPCFGRNENCRLCGGSGLISSEVEEKIARPNVAPPGYYSGQSDNQKRLEIEKQNIAARMAIIAAQAEAAERQRQTSAIEAARRLEAAAREAQTPAGKLALKLALKLEEERDAKIAAERAAAYAEQRAKSIAYWNKRWGKS